MPRSRPNTCPTMSNAARDHDGRGRGGGGARRCSAAAGAATGLRALSTTMRGGRYGACSLAPPPPRCLACGLLAPCALCRGGDAPGGGGGGGGGGGDSSGGGGASMAREGACRPSAATMLSTSDSTSSQRLWLTPIAMFGSVKSYGAGWRIAHRTPPPPWLSGWPSFRREARGHTPYVTRAPTYAT